MRDRHVKKLDARGEWVDVTPEEEAAAYRSIGMTPADVEFIRAQAEGEISGDVIEVDDNGRCEEPPDDFDPVSAGEALDSIADELKKPDST